MNIRFQSPTILCALGCLLLFPSMPFARTFMLVSLESPPAEFTENGRVTGRNVDVVTEAIKRMGHTCDIRLLPWVRAVNMVKKGRADGLIDAAYNQERAQFFHYPEKEIYVEKWFAFKRKTMDLTLDPGLANAHIITIGASRGFEYGGELQQAINENRFKLIQEVTGNEQNIKKLLANRFDMFVGVKLTILWFVARMGVSNDIDIVKKTGSAEEYILSTSKTFLAFSKKTVDPAIADRFSRIIQGMEKDGTSQRIESRYF